MKYFLDRQLKTELCCNNNQKLADQLRHIEETNSYEVKILIRAYPTTVKLHPEEVGKQIWERVSLRLKIVIETPWMKRLGYILT